MNQFFIALQASHDGLRIVGSIAAAVVLLSCLAIGLIAKPSRLVIAPAITLGLGVIVLGWALYFLESA